MMRLSKHPNTDADRPRGRRLRGATLLAAAALAGAVSLSGATAAQASAVRPADTTQCGAYHDLYVGSTFADSLSACVELYNGTVYGYGWAAETEAVQGCYYKISIRDDTAGTTYTSTYAYYCGETNAEYIGPASQSASAHQYHVYIYAYLQVGGVWYSFASGSAVTNSPDITG